MSWLIWLWTKLLFKGFHTFAGVLLFMYLLSGLNFCSTTEFQNIGITEKIFEEYFYGNQFKVRLFRVDAESLSGLKSDLKNMLADSDNKNRVDEWRKISELSLKGMDILIFQLIPDTRVVPEFLEFTFECAGRQFSPVYKYYTLNTSVSGRVYSYPLVMGLGPAGPYYPYYYRSYPQDLQVSVQTKHTYSFVFSLPPNSCMTKKRDRFKVYTPSKNIIEFES